MNPNKNTQNGQVIVLLALFMIVLLVAIGLAVDAAVLFQNRADLASRADSAALAGGAELTNTDLANASALQYLALHNVITPTHTISVTFRSSVVANDIINVKIWRDVPTSFMHLVGIDTVAVSAEAEVWATAWAGQQNWPMYRGGPARTGFQTCNGLDTNVDSLQYSFGHRWLTSDGAAHRSTPATYQDNRMFSGHTFVVVGSNDNGGGGNGTSAQGGAKVYAFDTIDGTTLWTSNLNASNTKVRSSPLITIVPGLNGTSGDEYPVVFVGGHNGRVYALDARDGSIVWTSPNDNDEFEGDSMYRSSPALLNESGTYYVYQATSRGNIYKYNALTGSMIWRSTPFPGTYPYPNPNVPDNWVTTSWGSAPGNTEDYWGYTTIYGTVNIANIPGLGLTIFIVNHGKNEGWGAADPDVYLFAIRASDGTKIWASSKMDVLGGNNVNHRDSSAVGYVDTDYNGNPDQWRVYVTPTDGYLYAFDAVTGATIWEETTGFKHHRGDPIIYCDIVFGGNEDGMWALTAADGYSIWDNVDSDGGGPDAVNPEYNTTDYTTDGIFRIPGGVKSAPALTDGIVMVGANETSSGGTGGSMWALETRTGKDLGHWDTTAYNYPVNGLGPAGPPSGNNGDVRSGVVIANNFNAYFGSKDTGLYEVYITAVIILVK